MSLQTTIHQVVLEVGITSIGKLVESVFYLAVIFFGLRYIGKAISIGLEKILKKIPDWIHLYFTELQKAKTLDRALESRRQ